MIRKSTYEELEQRIRKYEKKFLNLQQTEKELKKSKEERTAELRKANAQLKNELKERKRTGDVLKN